MAIYLSGCASSGPQSFSWYHPQGGEYLFEFDKNACHANTLAQDAASAADTSSPFFQCMHERGYYLVDGERVVQGPIAMEAPNPPVATAR